MKEIIIVSFCLLICLLMGKIIVDEKADRVMVPAHIFLDTLKYKILKEDSLALNGMQVKRVYYIERKK